MVTDESAIHKSEMRKLRNRIYYKCQLGRWGMLQNCNGGPLKLLGFTDKPTARNGNISLEVEEYCFGCEEFMPVRKIERIYTGDNPTEINVTVQCGQKDRCRRIADRIQAPRPKKIGVLIGKRLTGEGYDKEDRRAIA